MTGRRTKTKTLTDKTCKQIADLVLGYLDDRLNPAIKRAFERHLGICPDCVSFLKTYKKTIQAAGTLDVAKMPAKARDNILSFLRKRMGRIGVALIYLIHQLVA